uniref:Uncharacterized protein n=1 Tax=Phlebotomus papatasi TaxID=29031 RepID=A0A1B0D6S7_PHLPP
MVLMSKQEINDDNQAISKLIRFSTVKIWFQNRRMKWKRSKKAQQEAKSKDHSLHSNNGSSNISDSDKSSSSSSSSMPKTPTAPGIAVQSGEKINNEKQLTALPENAINRNFGVMKSSHIINSSSNNNNEQHRIVNNLMTSNLNNFSNLVEESVPASAILNRRGVVFTDGVMSNGDMFRPYVV